MTPEPTDHPPESIIPGMTPAAFGTLQLVIKDAVSEGVKAGLAEYEESRIGVLRSDVAGHHTTLYGEDGRGGLCAVVQEIQTTVRASRKLAWAAIGAGITAVPAGVLSVILFFASRGG